MTLEDTIFDSAMKVALDVIAGGYKRTKNVTNDYGFKVEKRAYTTLASRLIHSMTNREDLHEKYFAYFEAKKSSKKRYGSIGRFVENFLRFHGFRK